MQRGKNVWFRLSFENIITVIYVYHELNNKKHENGKIKISKMLELIKLVLRSSGLTFLKQSKE